MINIDTNSPSQELEGQSHWLERLDDYVDLFRDDFRRRDQIRWASVYLQGLLLEGQTKTIGAMARRVLLPPDLVGGGCVAGTAKLRQSEPLGRAQAMAAAQATGAPSARRRRCVRAR